jgi:hypothetical protein
MNTLKKILKFILYAGAVGCCLAGLWIIYVTIVNFHEMPNSGWAEVLAMQAIFICLSFTPAVMFILGLKTKTLQWVVIAIVEAIVMALAAIAFLAKLAGGE